MYINNIKNKSTYFEWDAKAVAIRGKRLSGHSEMKSAIDSARTLFLFIMEQKRFPDR
jgi:hypothetical protein